MNITILGTGAYGLALSSMFLENNCNITMWTKSDEEKIRLVNDKCNKKVLPDYVIDEKILITCNLEEAIKRYRENDTWPKTTTFTKESFDHLQDIMIDYGALDKKVPYNKLIYNEK